MNFAEQPKRGVDLTFLSDVHRKSRYYLEGLPLVVDCGQMIKLEEAKIQRRLLEDLDRAEGLLWDIIPPGT